MLPETPRCPTSTSTTGATSKRFCSRPPQRSAGLSSSTRTGEILLFVHSQRISLAARPDGKRISEKRVEGSSPPGREFLASIPVHLRFSPLTRCVRRPGMRGRFPLGLSG
jgi:hypothetical protein